MDEIAKEPAHRASVSMPSLDAADDFPVPTTSASSTDQTDCAFVATDATFDSPVVTDALTSDSISYSSVDTGSVENTQSLEGASIEDNSETLQPEEALDDSQGEEDPSIAIDQFIKKIADEQLSSKRIGAQEEEENDEEKDTNVNSDLPNETKVADIENGENIPEAAPEVREVPKDDVSEANAMLSLDNISESASVQQDSNMSAPEIPETLDETLKGDVSEVNISLPIENNSSQDSVAPIDVDIQTPLQEDSASKVQENAKETASNVDFMQAESIEEIQKEIDKIPPKKNSETTQNGKLEEPIKIEKNENENHSQKSIEQILCDDWEKNEEPEDEKSIFGTENSQDTSAVSRDPLLIESAQEEMKRVDVLVCGECHSTFHYVEEFSAHKSGKCTQASQITGVCENESKPQVWGFVLWKTRLIKELGQQSSSPWSIYQRWCKLSQDDKNAWITAGQSIQYACKIGNAKVTEVRGKQNKQVLVQKVLDNESMPIEFVDSNKENADHIDGDGISGDIIKKTISKPVKLNNDVTIMPSNKIGSPHRDLTNTAIRTTKILSTQKQEFVVEKIVAKRFNPRKKTWEYNIKWENFASDANTWEPISNLNHCKLMLEQFEEQLKRVKEEKAKQTQTAPKGRGRPPNRSYKATSGQYVPIAPKISSPKISNVIGGVSEDYGSSGRPQRSSKQKALNQVKAWCGNISDEDSSGYKRRHDDDSDEDYDDKRVKLEEESDDSDRDVRPKLTVKKVTKPHTPITVKNGSTGAQQILPSNILIPDANGVVRINQKQLPSLSSGVYIMSKTAGIIKLDSSTSKVATSGGQTIVKVAPKIGQTQIKIVKKEGNTTKQIIQVSPKSPLTSTPIKVTPVKVTTQKPTAKIRKVSSLDDSAAKFIGKYDSSKQSEDRSDDDSDDGLEPLPFPLPDDPLPEPESPPGEFVLDPTTGKIAGKEYVDKPVIIKEEPQPIPPSTSELENIVKLAAADITEEDLQGDNQEFMIKFGSSNSFLQIDDPLSIEPKEQKPATIIHTIKSEGSNTGVVGIRRVVKYTTGQGISEGSILNKALTQVGAPQQRTRVVQQKVINSMVSQRNPGQTKTVVRHVVAPQGSHGNMNVIRTRTVMPKPKFNLAPQKPFPSPLQPTRTYSAVGGMRQVGGSAANKMQVYSTKSSGQVGQVGGITRKVGPTMVRTAGGQKVQTQYTQRQPTTRIVQRVVTTTRKSDGSVVTSAGSSGMVSKMASSKPKAVINMPSLTDDDSAAHTIAKIQKQEVSNKTAITAPVKQEALPQQEIQESLESANAAQPETTDDAAGEGITDWSSFTMADSDNPIYITGDDGTIYQVAGQNEQGQTILITQGPDGQQQCLLVTNEIGETGTEEQPSTSEGTGDTGAVLGIPEDSPLQDAVPAVATVAVSEDGTTPLQIKTDTEMEGIEEGLQDQVVAQVVRAEPPSPGGTHKVVVMLPDGNLMVTQVSPEEYASLELE